MQGQAGADGTVALRSAQRAFGGYLATPKTPGPWPAVLVIHELFGLTPWVREVADRLAGVGYLALAPDLFVGRVHKAFDPAAAERLMPLVWQMPVEARIVRAAFERALAGHREDDVELAWALCQLSQGLTPVSAMVDDLRACVEWLRAQPGSAGRVGAVGFCFGGRMAFALAAAEPRLAAAVVFYGAGPREDDIARVACPVLGLYGEDDEYITKDVPRVAGAMSRLSKPFEFEVYNRTGHAFARPSSAHFRQDRADQAWARVDDFLARHLKGGTS